MNADNDEWRHADPSEQITGDCVAMHCPELATQTITDDLITRGPYCKLHARLWVHVLIGAANATPIETHWTQSDKGERS